MFEKVLVSMDLSPATEALVSALPDMKEFGTRELALVHVAKPLQDPVRESLREVEELRGRLNGLADRLRAEGFEVTVDVPTGSPPVEVIKTAQARNPDLVLVGSRSHARIREAFVGSVAWEVVRRARRPVLLQRIEANRPDPEAALESVGAGLPRHVVHPTDFSEMAGRAIPWLHQLAEQGVPKFTLLHVLPVDASEGRGDAEASLAEIAQGLEEAGASEVRTSVRLGAPHEEVRNAGGKDPNALVVMGTHGRGFLPEMVLGSVSRQVVRHSSARVLLVPAQDNEA